MVALDARHHLSLGAERYLGDPLEAPLAPLRSAELALCDEKGGFGRIAVDLPLAARVAAQVGVAREAAAAEDDDVLGVHGAGAQRRAFSARRAPRARSRRP
jgi:hypothetical protein